MILSNTLPLEHVLPAMNAQVRTLPATPIKCRDGVLLGAGALMESGHQRKRAVPSSFPLTYGAWHSWYGILPSASLGHLSWIRLSPHYTPAYLWNMGNWGRSLVSLTISINVSFPRIFLILEAKAAAVVEKRINSTPVKHKHCLATKY